MCVVLLLQSSERGTSETQRENLGWKCTRGSSHWDPEPYSWRILPISDRYARAVINLAYVKVSKFANAASLVKRFRE